MNSETQTNVFERKDNSSANSTSASGDLPTRVCIINFTGERRNWGCRATSWELVRIMNRSMPVNTNYYLDCIPLVPHHKIDQSIESQHKQYLRSILTISAPNETEKKWMLQLARERYLHHIESLEKSDLIVFQAEGSMTGTDFSRADRLLILPWVAKHCFNKPVISLNQTLFSADHEFSKVLFAVLKTLDRVWVREPASLNWLHSNGLTTASLVADTAFLCDPLPHGSDWRNLEARETFCVTGSAILLENQLDVYLKVIKDISETTGLLPIFLASTEKDFKLVKMVQSQWPVESFYVVKRSLIYQAVADLLGKSKFLIGGRYHLSILAAINGTPSVLIETNTYKLSGLIELLQVNWPIRKIEESDKLLEDVLQTLKEPNEKRSCLVEKVNKIRSEIQNEFLDWYRIKKFSQLSNEDCSIIHPEKNTTFADINHQICANFKYNQKDTDLEKIGKPQAILPQLKALTVYLRRESHVIATFQCLRQLTESNLELVIDQLNARWLISICDSYADFGNPIESRNALLISSFLNWERIASSYINWSEPNRTTLRIDKPIPPKKTILWGGLQGIDLSLGDTTNNFLIRMTRNLEPTPHLLKIWRKLLHLISENDSVLAALNHHHKHIFDEDLNWLRDEKFIKKVPPWKTK